MHSEVIDDLITSYYLIQGASEIAKVLYGNSGPLALRRVYHLTSEVPPEYRMPCFKMGPQSIAIRKSKLAAYIERLENQALPEPEPKAPKQSAAARREQEKLMEQLDL